MKDLLVGRDDGTLEVWSFDLGPGRLIFERSLQSRSPRSRPASSPTSTTTSSWWRRSGKIISFSSEPSTGEAAEGGGFRERSSTAHTSAESRKEAKEKGDKKIRALRTELEGLRQKVDREREKYSKVSSRSSAPRCSSR